MIGILEFLPEFGIGFEHLDDFLEITVILDAQVPFLRENKSSSQTFCMAKIFTFQRPTLGELCIYLVLGLGLWLLRLSGLLFCGWSGQRRGHQAQDHQARDERPHPETLNVFIY